MFIDISRQLDENIYVYEGDPVFRTSSVCSIADGDDCNVTAISFGSHTGTHIDAPKHFFKDGKSITDFPIDAFCGKTKVIEIKDNIINASVLKSLEISENDIILFKTENSVFDGITPLKKSVYISTDTAEYLVGKKIKLVGIDYISADSTTSHDYPVHNIFLGNNIPILENIKLSDVKPGIYKLYCFPLFIKNCDASPVRAVLETI